MINVIPRLILVLAATSAHADMKGQILEHLKAADPRVYEVKISNSKRINARYSVVSAEGSTKTDAAPPHDLFMSQFGIFVVDNKTSSVLIKLDVVQEERKGDFWINIDRVTKGSASVTFLTNYGGYNKTYEFDLEKKMRTKGGEDFPESTDDVRFSRSFNQGNELYLVGSFINRRQKQVQTVVFRIKSVGSACNDISSEIYFGLPYQLGNREIPVEMRNGSLSFYLDDFVYRLDKSGWKKTKNDRPDFFKYNSGSAPEFGLGKINFWVSKDLVEKQLIKIPVGANEERFLIWNNEISANSGGEHRSGIYLVGKENLNFSPLPQPDLKEVCWSNGDTCSVENNIGPYELKNKKLWFGTTFYDGEGVKGQGAIGIFDFVTRKFNLSYPKELKRWSVSSIFLDGGEVWVATNGNHEGAGETGPVMVSPQTSWKPRTFHVKDPVWTIAKLRDRIFFGTGHGILTLCAGSLKPHSVKITSKDKISL